ncbi:MAG: hypothetical protein ACLFTK_10140, partial [Anaerolineales bacterium]
MSLQTWIIGLILLAIAGGLSSRWRYPYLLGLSILGVLYFQLDQAQSLLSWSLAALSVGAVWVTWLIVRPTATGTLPLWASGGFILAGGVVAALTLPELGLVSVLGAVALRASGGLFASDDLK